MKISPFCLLLSFLALAEAFPYPAVRGETTNRRAELSGTLNSTFEAQLEKILEESGDLNMKEIKKRVDELVAATDEKTRARHEEWKRLQHKKDNEKRMRMKDALLRLSPAAQARLIRLILVQENEDLSQNEKRSRLVQISRGITPQIRSELTRHLKDSDLFNEFSSHSFY